MFKVILYHPGQYGVFSDDTYNVCEDVYARFEMLVGNEEFENIEDTSLQENPESLYQQKEISHSLNEALEELPFYEKEVIIMRFYNDMKLRRAETLFQIC